MYYIQIGFTFYDRVREISAKPSRKMKKSQKVNEPREVEAQTALFISFFITAFSLFYFYVAIYVNNVKKKPKKVHCKNGIYLHCKYT